MTTRPAVAALALVLSAAAFAADQGHPKKVAPKKKSVAAKKAPTSVWVNTKMSPMDLAKRTDNTLHTLVSTTLEYQYQFNLPIGKGISNGLGAIKTQKQFRLEFPKIGNTEETGVRRIALIANNGKLSTIVEGVRDEGHQKSAYTSIPDSRPLPSDMVSAWLTGNVGLLFTAIGSNSNPLEKLVTTAAKSGYEVKAESRTYTMENRKYTQYRIVVLRPKSLAKKDGALFYEIDINDRLFLPVSMNNFIRKGPKTYVTTMHGTVWNIIPNQKYPKGTFNQELLHLGD